MRDGTKFSTWKDFALAVMEELDDLYDRQSKLEEDYLRLKADYIKFRAIMWTVAIILTLIVGIFEIGIRI